MTRRSQRAYLSMSTLFLTIGGVGVGLGLVDGAFSLGLFRGNPALTAFFLVAIGMALRWTAMRAEVRAEPRQEHDGGDDGSGDGDDGSGDGGGNGDGSGGGVGETR